MLLTAKIYPNFVRIVHFSNDLQPKQIFRQTNFVLSHSNELAMVPKWKGDLYNNIYTYIQIGAFVVKLPVIKHIACIKISEIFLNSHKL